MTRRHPSIACPLATALALALLLPGCSLSGGSGGDAAREATSGAAASGARTSGERSAAGAPSVTGYDGALLPGNLRPREFTLTNQHGRRISLSDVRGKVAILAFLYTASKTTAPLIAQQIRGALDELEAPPPRAAAARRTPRAQQVPTLAISLDPAGDRPGRVRAFLRAASLTGRMEYLTGTVAQLRPVWRAYAAAPASAGPAAYERSAFVLLLDRQGAPRVEFPLEQLTPEALAHDIRRLQRESTKSR